MGKKKEISNGLVAAISILAVFIFLVLITVGWVWGSYNTFVIAKQDINTQLSNVKTEYQRRADLIPNLVEVTKGYAKHEMTTFTDVAKMSQA